MIRPYILIPCYNHGSTLERVLKGLEAYALPVLIVDDGSEPRTAHEIDRLLSLVKGVSCLRLPKNSGKGVAVMEGIRWGAAQGFTHAVQVDADGQHDLSKVKVLLEQANQHPDALISGRPIYDKTVPKKRLYGRYLTHVWVWIETASFTIADSLCGFRVYPIASTLALSAQRPFGRRMDFDPEVMVRLYWAGVPIRFVDVAVVYPPGGLSHFDALKDNVRLSRLHARLFFEAFYRLPLRWWRRSASHHWARLPERQGAIAYQGMRFLYGLYRLGGRGLFKAALWPVMALMWLTGREQREAAQGFLARVRAVQAAQGLPPTTLTSLALFERFGESILDRILAWKGELVLGRDVRFGDEQTRALLTDSRAARGTLLWVSHLGVTDASRALAQYTGMRPIHVLLFDAHAQAFKATMRTLAPDSQRHVVAVDKIGVETALYLKDAIDRGDWVAIAADRVSVQDGAHRREVRVPFLGEEAAFPVGPYVLAELLETRVVCLFVVHEQGALTLYASPFSEGLERVARHERQATYEAYATQWAAILAEKAIRYPGDWFNFYDFWAKRPENGASGQARVGAGTPEVPSKKEGSANV